MANMVQEDTENNSGQPDGIYPHSADNHLRKKLQKLRPAQIRQAMMTHDNVRTQPVETIMPTTTTSCVVDGYLRQHSTAKDILAIASGLSFIVFLILKITGLPSALEPWNLQIGLTLGAGPILGLMVAHLLMLAEYYRIRRYVRGLTLAQMHELLDSPACRGDYSQIVVEERQRKIGGACSGTEKRAAG